VNSWECVGVPLLLFVDGRTGPEKRRNVNSPMLREEGLYAQREGEQQENSGAIQGENKRGPQDSLEGLGDDYEHRGRFDSMEGKGA
jgi:hypothetical protein